MTNKWKIKKLKPLSKFYNEDAFNIYFVTATRTNKLECLSYTRLIFARANLGAYTRGKYVKGAPLE